MFADDDYSHGYGQIKQVLGCLTKDDNFQRYISDRSFRSFNTED